MVHSYVALRIFLVLVATTFITYGVGAVFSQELPVAISKVIAESSFEFTEQTRFLARLMGTFSLFTGVLALLGAVHPYRNRIVTLWLAALLLFRGAERIFYSAEIQGLFDVPPIKNLFHASYLIFLGLALLVLYPREKVSDL